MKNFFKNAKPILLFVITIFLFYSCGKENVIKPPDGNNNVEKPIILVTPTVETEIIKGDTTDHLITHPKIKNNTAQPMEIKMVVTPVLLGANHKFYFCDFEICHSPSDVEMESNSFILQPGEISGELLYIELSAAVAGKTEIKVKFYNIKNPVEAVSYTVKYYYGVEVDS